MSYAYADRELTSSARADRILSRAEGRRAPALSKSRVFEIPKIDAMDKLALLVAAIMTIGPLFAAYVGSLMIS